MRSASQRTYEKSEDFLMNSLLIMREVKRIIRAELVRKTKVSRQQMDKRVANINLENDLRELRQMIDGKVEK